MFPTADQGLKPCNATEFVAKNGGGLIRVSRPLGAYSQISGFCWFAMRDDVTRLLCAGF
jgi:hypothetical protein